MTTDKIADGFRQAEGGLFSPVEKAVVAGGIAEQAEQVMANIGAILAAAGSSYANVIKTTCFIYDMADFAAFNKVYEKWFVSKPARSCVAVKELPKGVLVEIEVIAAR